jgi:catechol 2,3-dioxygenase-like lactoylglutathione lyase family enzyme
MFARFRRLRMLRLPLLFFAASAAMAQADGTTPSTDAAALGACHVSPIVANLDSSATFYRELVGLSLYPEQKPGPLPWDTDPAHLDIHGTRGGRLRFVGARMPGVWCGVEIVEFADIDRKAVKRGLQEPGAVTLILLVRNLDTVFARLKGAGVPVVTTGGAPIVVGRGKTRAVIVQDPDGHFVELDEPDPLPADSAQPAGDVIGIRLRITTGALDPTLRVYRDRLGFQTQVRSFVSDKTVAALMGLADVEYRLTTARVPLRLNGADVPASAMQVEFIEFKGVERPLVRSRIQDPGSYRLFVNVRDLDTSVRSLRTVGSEVISTGGVPVLMTFGRGQWRIAAVTDPNNLFLVLLQNP